MFIFTFFVVVSEEVFLGRFFFFSIQSNINGWLFCFKAYQPFSGHLKKD